MCLPVCCSSITKLCISFVHVLLLCSVYQDRVYIMIKCSAQKINSNQKVVSSVRQDVGLLVFLSLITRG